MEPKVALHFPSSSPSFFSLLSCRCNAELDDMAAVELPKREKALLGGWPHPEGEGLLTEWKLQDPVLQIGTLALGRVKLDNVVSQALTATGAAMAVLEMFWPVGWSRLKALA